MIDTKYPTELMNLEEDSRAVAKYVRALNDPETDPAEVQQLLFKIGVRLMRIEKEVGYIGQFVDAVAAETTGA